MLNTLLISMLMLSSIKSPADVASEKLHAEIVDKPATTVKPLTELPSQLEPSDMDKMLRDPASPVVGAKYRALNIVTFVSYGCKYCKQLDSDLERLRHVYPRIAVTYKLVSPDNGVLAAATRMAITIWIEQPDKFHAFHHALMGTAPMTDDERVQAALKAAGLTLSKVRPKTQLIIDRNEALLADVKLIGMPTTVIGGKVISGPASYEELEQAVKEALKHADQ